MVGRAAVFHLNGTLGLEETAMLRKAFWKCINRDLAEKLILNLEGVPTLEPSAISLFIATKNVVSKRKGHLILVGIQKPNFQLLEQTHLIKFFDIRPGLEDVWQEGTLERC